MSKSSLKSSPFWLRGFRYYLRCVVRRKPPLVNLEVTKRCNARCRFCSYWSEDCTEELEDYTPVVKFFKPVVLSISGGEPLVRRDLPSLILRFRSYCHYVTVVTNGILLDEDRAAELSEAGVNSIAVSLDYLGQEHDEARGVPGLYGRISRTVPQLTSMGYNVGLNTVIMESNLDHILPLTYLSKEWGAYISFSSYCSLKKNDDSEMIRLIRFQQLREIVAEIKVLKRKGYNIKNSNYYLDRIPAYFRDGGVEGCRAGLDWVQITPDGYVKPCSEMEVICRYDEYSRHRVPDISCTHCWYACRGEAQANALAPDRLLELVRS